MNEKRLCSMGHPASWSGERASRFFAERSVGVLWHHSSVNLVGPVYRTGRADTLRRLPEIATAVSIPPEPPQPAGRLFSLVKAGKSQGFSRSCVEGNFPLTMLA
jgi:hypothetical protein